MRTYKVETWEEITERMKAISNAKSGLVIRLYMHVPVLGGYVAISSTAVAKCVPNVIRINLKVIPNGNDYALLKKNRK